MKTEFELKTLLQKIKPCSVNFEIIYTGKKSRRIDGKYFSNMKEIHINEKNCIESQSPDNELLLIALHEYAHHLQNTESYMKNNPHDTEFWSIYYDLVNSAENQGIYENVCLSRTYDYQFSKLYEKFLKFNKAMEEYFQILNDFSMSSCNDRNQYHDMVERVFKIPRGEIRKIRKMASANISMKGLNYNSILSLSSIPIEEEVINEVRVNINKEKKNGLTLDMLKFLIRGNKFDTLIEYLEDKKDKTESAIEKGKQKLIEIGMKLKSLIKE